MIPPRKSHQEENVDAWLMSYADMITLLLCFFIIFVAGSEPKKEKLAAITEGMINKFGSVELSTPFQNVYLSLQALTESKHLLQDMAVTKQNGSITIELSSLSLFKDRTADIDALKLPVLVEIADILKSAPYQGSHIIIEGHTNDLSASNASYASNWELSSARTLVLLHLFEERGITDTRLSTAAYAGTRPKVPNLDASGHAITQNRRLNERMVIRLEQVKP